MDEQLETSPPSDGASAPAESGLRAALEESYSKAESPAAEPASQAPAISTSATPEPTTAPPSEGETIPAGLQAKWKDKWATLDSEVKAEFSRYESNVGRLASKYGQAAKAWEGMERIAAPYSEMIRQEGGTLHGVLGNMLETSRLLRHGSPEQKLFVVHHIARAFGVPARQAEDGSLTFPSLQTSPELLSRLSSLEQRDLTSRAGVEYDVTTEVRENLDAFLADEGREYVKKPGYLDVMADLIRAGRAKGLEDAYEQAAWLHTETRPLEIAKQNQVSLAPQRQRTEQARAAAVSVSGNSPGAVTRDPSKMSLRESLEAAFDGELQ